MARPLGGTAERGLNPLFLTGDHGAFKFGDVSAHILDQGEQFTLQIGMNADRGFFKKLEFRLEACNA